MIKFKKFVKKYWTYIVTFFSAIFLMFLYHLNSLKKKSQKEIKSNIKETKKNEKSVKKDIKTEEKKRENIKREIGKTKKGIDVLEKELKKEVKKEKDPKKASEFLRDFAKRNR